MNDIEMAVELLEKEKLTLAVVRDGRLLYSSAEKGIKPLYDAYKKNMDLRGSSAADKVTGKAAAIICIEIGIKELNTGVMSENAVNAFKNSDIKYKYDLLTPYIKNRNNTGMCPIETISLKSADISELINGIEEFFQTVK